MKIEKKRKPALKPFYAGLGNYSYSLGFAAFWFILPLSSLNSCINKMDSMCPFHLTGLPRSNQTIWSTTKHFVIAHTSQLLSNFLISELPNYNSSQSCLQLKDLAYNGIGHTN